MALQVYGNTIDNHLSTLLKNNPSYLIEYNSVLSIINTARCNLWQDKSNIYYKSRGRNIASGNSNSIVNIINKDLNINISIVSIINLVEDGKHLDEIEKSVLIRELIPYAHFNPLRSEELYFDKKLNKYYKNKFYYTEYLKVREEPKDSFVSLSKSIIYTIIYNMVTNKDDFKYVMNWLAKFFQDLRSLDSLVLIGEKKVSENIFWEEIILPIFGKDFCQTVNSSVLKKEKYSKYFVSDKIFYNVNSLNHFSAKSRKTKEFINDLTISVDSQTLFSFTNENNPVLEELRNYKTVKIKSLKNIVKDMGYSSEKEVYKEIEKDLMNFSKILQNHKV